MTDSTDPSVVAPAVSRLGRAADQLAERIEAAPKGAEWGHLLRRLQADAYPPEFVFFVAWADPHTVAALLPALKATAEQLRRHGMPESLQAAMALDHLDVFAARLLGEEETGG